VKSWRYVYSGLQVISELELPEWESFLHPEPFAATDVLILVEAAQEREPAAVETLTYISATEYRFFVPGTASYCVKNGSEIIVSPVTGAGSCELRLFLLGSAWGALCYQRGLLAIHASVVCIGDNATVFCGHPGKGKSTLTAWLAARGHALVSDDLCCIDMSLQERTSVYPSTPHFRLWSDALDVLGYKSYRLERDHFRFDKFILPWLGEMIEQPVPLRAIYLLEWGEFNVQRMSGLNALQGFVSAATYRGFLLDRMGLSGSYWQRCLELVRRVPVWQLTRPKDLTQMDTTLTILLSHWQSNIPAEKAVEKA